MAYETQPMKAIISFWACTPYVFIRMAIALIGRALERFALKNPKPLYKERTKETQYNTQECLRTASRLRREKPGRLG